MKNGYNRNLINKISKEVHDKVNSIKHKPDIKNDNGKFYYNLVVPYSENFRSFKNVLVKSVKNMCNLRVISKTFKTQNMFRNKSRTPFELCSNVVYQFNCHQCNAAYIGETARHLCTRIKEHKRESSNSQIFEHNLKCNSQINISSFKIVATNFDNYWQRLYCESLAIKSFNPRLNIQKNNTKSNLKLFC